MHAWALFLGTLLAAPIAAFDLVPDPAEQSIEDRDAAPAPFGTPAIRGWVVFDGTSASSFSSGHNVLSVTRNAPGDFTIRWVVPFTTTSYAILGTCGQSGSNNDCFVILNTDAPASGSVNIKTVRGDRSPVDFKYVSLVAIGD